MTRVAGRRRSISNSMPWYSMSRAKWAGCDEQSTVGRGNDCVSCPAQRSDLLVRGEHVADLGDQICLRIVHGCSRGSVGDSEYSVPPAHRATWLRALLSMEGDPPLRTPTTEKLSRWLCRDGRLSRPEYTRPGGKTADTTSRRN
jgi:hypothetical protein